MKTLLGLIGHPVAHSFSAEYFSHRFSSLGWQARYELFDMPHLEALPTLLATHTDLVGLNVTSPHKEHIISYLDKLAPCAQEIGAVNVVQIARQDGSIHTTGFNTDAIGFLLSLEEWKHELQGQHAIILGSGGAAKAVAHALASIGIGYTMVSRQGTHPPHTIGYDALTSNLVKQCRLIVQATPIGLHRGELPLFPYQALSPWHMCYDLIYNPTQTPFLLQANKAQAQTKNGLEMLHLQADAAWHIWGY